MAIAIFPKLNDETSKRIAEDTIEHFVKNNINVVVEDDKAIQLSAPPLSSIDLTDIKFMVTMGGDGSILRVAHKYQQIDGAILGINLGHLGFMAEVQSSEVISGLNKFLAGEYEIQRMMMIESISHDNKPFLAINDCVFHRAHNTHLIKLSVDVNGSWLNTFQADGLILATPNGSTAYSLSAGGPIVMPGINGFILTPICPHTLPNRPIVIPSTAVITVTCKRAYTPIEVVSDGLHKLELNNEQHVTMKKSSKSFNLVRLNNINHSAVLRGKLGWVGSMRD